MTNTDSITCRDLHLRHTGADGKSFVQQHRVWDTDRFLAARQADAAEANARAKDSKAKVELITAEQYRAERAR